MYAAKAALYTHQRQSTNIRTFTKGGIYALPCLPHCMSGLVAYRCINAGYACALYNYMIKRKCQKIEYLHMHQLCKPKKHTQKKKLSKNKKTTNKSTQSIQKMQKL